ncbi:hypothetical protein Tco_0018113 [Tanacetum coccineum]
MLLLLVQQKLINLTIYERYDLNVALRMFTRRIVIQKRVEDLQLGVESYQKKLNLTKPDTYKLNIRNKTAYTSHSDPRGIIYVDQFKRKRLMRTDELNKFSDGTLNDVRTALHDIAAGIENGISVTGSSGKSAHEEEPSYTVEDSVMQQYQEFITEDNDEQPTDKRQVNFRPPQTLISQAALAEEPTTSIYEFNDTSFDFSAFVMNRLKIPNLTQEILDYIINKDLEYLKGEDLNRHYSTLVTKTKAATYELKWIEDLVHKLWSPMVVKYDQHAYFSTSHWGPKHQSFYGYASNLTSSKDVYSRRRIIAVTRLTIMKKYDYGHLEEIEVRRDD